jgi:Na+/H+-dicarboxylate symporter
MKTWITYIAAIALGFAANLLVGDLEILTSLVASAVPILLDLGMLLLFPLVFILFASGIASLRRQAETTLLFSSTILWSLATTLILTGFAAALYFLLPLGIQNITTNGADASALSTINAIQPSRFFAMIVNRNSFLQFVMTDQSLLPVLVLALLLGLALKPDMEAIRPAYVVMNSFAEAMLRLARIFTILGALFIGFISFNWFNSVDAEGRFFANLEFFTMIGITLASALFILLPLTYALFTGFKGGNPYRVLFGGLSAYLAGFFSGNILYAGTSIIALSRQNNGVRKRVAGTAVPLYTVLGRGGSAMVATTAALALIVSFKGSLPSWQAVMAIGLLSSLFSLICSFHLGYETLFIVVMVLRNLEINLEGAEMMLVVLLPFLNGFGALLDSAIATFGAAYTSRLVSPDDLVAYRDFV